ncbi:MAG: gliding motility-associated C-terminal domain-containing protein, partial [Bacteroidia bacterium]
NSVLGCQSVSNRVSGQFKDIIAPAIPILDSVSVGPGGNIEITWYPSSSTNAMGYVVYEWKPPLIEIDSIFGRDSTSLSFTGSSPDSASWSFYVSAFDSCGNVSSYSPPQKTIFLKDTSLKCLQENELIWTKYIDFSPGVGKYNIYESLNGHPFTLLASVLDTGINDTTYIQTGLSTPQSLCYYVQVVGAKDSNITASSNKVCYTVTVPPPPKFSYMRSATVITNSTENQVNWYVDTGADAAEYIIERYDSSKDRYDIIGTVAAVANQLNYSFTDPTANPNTDSYIYKVFVKDECNYIIDSTNIGQTIFLTAFGNGTGQNMLAWNDYSKWLKGVSYYNIYRNEDDGPFNLVGSVKYSGNGGTYTDDVSSIITGQGVFGYYIQAVEISPEPTYPFIDSSTSNIAEAYQNPRLYVPNAFNPKGANTIFKPVGVFVDLQNYDFSIYDRWGELLFETTDPTQGWDGTYHGKLVEEGIYIYRIEYTSNTGEFYTQRSWVMMLK